MKQNVLEKTPKVTTVVVIICILNSTNVVDSLRYRLILDTVYRMMTFSHLRYFEES